jgi:hypothetical protein
MKIELSERRRRHVVGVLLTATALLVGVSLASYRAPLNDEAFSATNWAGRWARWSPRAWSRRSESSRRFGLPLVLLAWAVNRLRARPAAPLALETAFGALLVIEALALVGWFGARTLPYAGAVGLAIAGAARAVLGGAGGAIALITVFLVTGLVASEIGFGLVTSAWRLFVKAPLRALFEGARERHAQVRSRAEQSAAAPPPAASASALTAIEPARPRRRERVPPPPPVIRPPRLRLKTPSPSPRAS